VVWGSAEAQDNDLVPLTHTGWLCITVGSDVDENLLGVYSIIYMMSDVGMFLGESYGRSLLSSTLMFMVVLECCSGAWMASDGKNGRSFARIVEPPLVI